MSHWCTRNSGPVLQSCQRRSHYGNIREFLCDQFCQQLNCVGLVRLERRWFRLWLWSDQPYLQWNCLPPHSGTDSFGREFDVGRDSKLYCDWIFQPLSTRIQQLGHLLCGRKRRHSGQRQLQRKHDGRRFADSLRSLHHIRPLRLIDVRYVCRLGVSEPPFQDGSHGEQRNRSMAGAEHDRYRIARCRKQRCHYHLEQHAR